MKNKLTGASGYQINIQLANNAGKFSLEKKLNSKELISITGKFYGLKFEKKLGKFLHFMRRILLCKFFGTFLLVKCSF